MTDSNAGPSVHYGGSLSVAELRERLREAEETLAAIRDGEVDAVVVKGPSGQRVYTLDNADRPYRALIEQMQEGAVTLTREGIILYCNQRFAVTARAKPHRVVGARMDSFLAKGAAERFGRLLAGLHGGNAASEFSLIAGDGHEVPVNISIAELRGDAGWSPVICAVVTDLTHTHRRNDELRATNERLAKEIEERARAEGGLQLALDAAGMGSWELRLSTGKIQRSLRHDQIFGYPNLQPSWDLAAALSHFLPEDRVQIADAFGRAQVTGSIDIEGRIRRAQDSEVRWVHVRGQTFYSTGAAVRLAGVITDITDRRIVEERLRQAQKIEALGQLTGGVAHDFNNLLQVISSGLQIMGRLDDPLRRERMFGAMKQAVERGAGLCRQLLAFSRRQALKPEPVDVKGLIDGMRELLDRSLRGDVHIRCEFPDRLWPIEVDPGELELVILNLAVNARDAMPTGGSIVISAANAPDLADHELKGDFVHLTISDTGVGMPPDVLAHAFEPFFTTKEVGKGSGLGLAQTHGFAQASGGVVRIDSVPGQGTRVSLFLPRTLKKPPDPNLGTTEASMDLRAHPSGQVLLVEDDDEVAALAVEMINQLGYDTTRVASAEAALGALADKRTVDIVFSDVMMPGRMNGVELAKEIWRRRPNLPVLLTSGYAEAARRSAAAHRIKIISKPYRMDELRDALAAARQDARKVN